jgi:hypothetical protein
MTKSAPRQPIKAKQSKGEAKTFLLFGADEFAKPRAARHIATDQAALETAANRHHLRLVRVVGTALEDIAKRVPAGSIEAGYPAPLPFVPEDLYADLVDLTAGKQKQSPATNPATELPSTGGEIAAGHLVIAHESMECGWWEAIVLERAGELLTLRYRDFPAVPSIVRHLSAVALICSNRRNPGA